MIFTLIYFKLSVQSVLCFCMLYCHNSRWLSKQSAAVIIFIFMGKEQEWKTSYIHMNSVHSQKQLAHWAIDVRVEFYACLFSSSLMCNFWTVVLLLKWMSIWWNALEIIWMEQSKTWHLKYNCELLTYLKSLFMNSKITPGSLLMKVSAHDWRWTQSCLICLWTVEWANPSESVGLWTWQIFCIQGEYPTQQRVNGC